MRACLAFRGYAYREPHKLRQWGTDWRKCVESQHKYLIEPLKEKYDLSVVVCHYELPEPLLEQLKKDYQPTWQSVYVEWHTQRQMMIKTIRAIDKAEELGASYDFVCISRFDLEFISCPFTQPNFDYDKLSIQWREWNKPCWDHHKRIPDAIFTFPGRLLEGFKSGIEESPMENCLHTILIPVTRRIGEENVNVMSDRYLDSNSDVCPNPIYKIIKVH